MFRLESALEVLNLLLCRTELRLRRLHLLRAVGHDPLRQVCKRGSWELEVGQSQMI